MATLYAVLSAVQAAVSTATTGLLSTSPDTASDPLNVEVGIGWPSEKTLQNNVRSGPTPTALVAVYDRGLAANSTRWLSNEVGRIVTPATITADTSGLAIAPGGQITIALGATVTPGDAVAVVLALVLGQSNAVVAIAGSADTPTTMATQLTGLINADPILSTIVTATVAGPVVTVTSKASSLMRVQVNVGNGATRTTEVGRRTRQIQVMLWTRTEDDRIVAGDAIELVIAQLEADFGLTFPDGTLGRVLFVGDHQIEDATLADTYRRDFVLSVDYPITATDALYAILAPIARNTTF